MDDNNYLWDRTGKVDPEIQELEEVLGELRYRPRPLHIPADLRIGRRRALLPGLAIAATIALIAVALGIWFSLNRRQSAQQLQANTGSPVKQTPIAPEVAPPSPRVEQLAARNPKPADNRKRQRESTHNALLTRRNLLLTRRAPREIRQPELTPQELADKQRVLLALRLVSAKLSMAQRRTQGALPQNIIRNHRIG